jgi:hypothetical protein
MNRAEGRPGEYLPAFFLEKTGLKTFRVLSVPIYSVFINVNIKSMTIPIQYYFALTGLQFKLIQGELSLALLLNPFGVIF